MAADAPPDPFGFIRYSMILLGVSMMFAYRAFMVAPDYVNKYYQFAANDADLPTAIPDVWDNMVEYIVVASTFPNFFGMLYIISPQGQRIPMLTRLLLGMVFVLLSVVVITGLPLLTVTNEYVSLTVLLGATVICSIATAFFQSAVFAMGAVMPANYMQGAMVGQGVSGALCAAMQIGTKALLNGSFRHMQQQALLFFGLSILLLVVSIFLVFAVRRSAFARHFLPVFCGVALPDESPAVAVSESEQPLLVDCEKPINSEQAINSDAYVAVEEVETTDDTSPRKIRVILSFIWPRMLANFLALVASLSTFPGVGVMVDLADGWFGVIVIFLYCLGDMISRLACRSKRVHIAQRWLLPIAAARFAVIIPFVLCVYPRVIPGHGVPYALMFINGLGNGYLSTLCMMYGPNTPLLRKSEKSLAGSSMALSLLGGCSIGALSGLAITTVLADLRRNN
jgi:hypothetical protein